MLLSNTNVEFLIPILAFLAVYEFSNRIKINSVVAAIIVTAIPVLVAMCIKSIKGEMYNLQDQNNFIMILLFFVAYLLIFYKSQDDDSLMGWFIYGTIGAGVVPLLVPWLTIQIIQFL